MIKCRIAGESGQKMNINVSVETAQPGDRTTNPDIVMPECYASSQRVDSLARVVITPVRHTHTRLHKVDKHKTCKTE